ncbi:hypothetical protein [Streptomyces sp. NPDC048636]|uniref:hypothetical protein n=1 Tax=Streptomyces sp. NPDC048636 TaxID=3155762 RepID=UPI00343E50F6
MHVRLTTAAVLAAVLLPLTAGCGSQEQGTAERGKSGDAAEKRDKADATKAGKVGKAECGPDSDLTQDEWMDTCVDEDEEDATVDESGPEDKRPGTELAVGDTFRYDDGLKVTVTGIEKVTTFAEYDSPPSGDETAFRINITFDNRSENPVDLDEFSVNGQGATKGGDSEFTTWDTGSKEIAGRLAPGMSDTKNSDGVLDKQYGSQLLVTVTRMTEDAEVLAEDPHWTGPIA